MVFHQPKHIPVIKVYFQELVNKFLECHIDYGQKIVGILLSELKTPPLSHEHFLAPIFQHDFDLIVPKECISERICFLATYIVQHFISERSRERIMYTSIIQLPEIYAYPYVILLPLLL